MYRPMAQMLSSLSLDIRKELEKETGEVLTMAAMWEKLLIKICYSVIREALKNKTKKVEKVHDPGGVLV